MNDLTWNENVTDPSCHESPWGAPEYVLIVALAAMFVARISGNVVDLDLWHEMALARESLSLGYVPREDSFAFTPTVTPMVQHEWGAGVIAYLIADKSGAVGIVLLRWTLAFACFAITGYAAFRRGASLPVVGLLAPIPILMADEGFSPVRAQMYSFVGCALLLYWLERDRQGAKGWLVPWVVVFLIWLNVHAGFLVGAGLYLINWAERWARGEFSVRLLAVGCLMLGMIAVNPYGHHYYTYLFSAVRLDRPYIQEWSPIWVSAGPRHWVAYGLACGIAMYAVVRCGWDSLRTVSEPTDGFPPRSEPLAGERPHRRETFRTVLTGLPLVVVTAYIAAKHGRMLPFFAITWCVYVPAYLEDTAFGELLRRTWQNQRMAWGVIWGIGALALGISIVDKTPWRLEVPGIAAAHAGAVTYPVGPVDYLSELQFAGNVWTPFDQGSYVSWKMHPDVKISMDSRYEVAFPPQALDVNYSFYVGETTIEEAIHDETDAVLTMRWMAADKKLTASENWRQVYVDDAFALYVRQERADAFPFRDRRGEPIEGEFP